MIPLSPIGCVRSLRKGLQDDEWGAVEASIELSEDFAPESLDGLEEFSHVEVIFFFDRVAESQVERGSRHPRENLAWPKVGIFAQRGKNRPNRLGLSIARLLGREGRVLRVQGLDAIDGSPVIDIKPLMTEFLPTGEIRQPEWSREIMRRYWH